MTQRQLPGIFPVMVGLAFHWLFLNAPLTVDFWAWYAGHSVVVMAIIVALVTYVLITSTGPQSWLGEAVGEESLYDH